MAYKKESRVNEHIVFVIMLLLFAIVLVLIEPSYTAYTSTEMGFGGILLPFFSLILVMIGVFILYKKIF